jgi:chemotaxis response regulator CheB
MGRYEIVAIGSSAGGIRALEILLSGLPSDLPVPVLIVQHLGPRHSGLMAEAIKEKGGFTIAQNQETSEHLAMPQAAIETGMVDLVLPLEDIAPTIVRLVQEANDACRQ